MPKKKVEIKAGIEDVETIKTFATEIKLFNSDKREAQLEDQEYYDDDFGVSIKQPFHIVRTGTAPRIIDSIVDHIELSNPQVFREPKGKSEAARKSALKVVRFLNFLIRGWADEIAEFTRNNVHRGEAIGQVEFDSSAYNKKKEETGWEHITDKLPLKFSAPDPLNVHTFPYDALTPSKVVKSFRMKKMAVKALAPEWVGRDAGAAEVEYLAYWSSQSRYIEAGGEALSKDVENNYLGFAPFVHCYSGAGKKSPEGKPETLAVGRLRKIHGRLKEECEIESRIDSIIGLFANPLVIYQATVPDASPLNEDELKKQVIGPGETITAPYGWKVDIYTPDVASAQLFQHLYQIRQALGMDIPPIMAGVGSGSGTSGRKEDILFEHIQKRYSKLIGNMEEALATLLGMALRILDVTPKALPVSITATIIKDGKSTTEVETIAKEDIAEYYDCTVKLNPEEALEADRKVMLGMKLLNETRISWKHFLVHYMSKTEDEAEDMITDALAEVAVLTDPLMRQIRVMEAIEQAGMGRYLEQLKTDARKQELMQGALQEQPQGQARPSEARNPTAAGIMRQSLNETPVGVRKPPQEAA